MVAGRINLQKASGGITAITGVDGTGNTELVLPESGELVTKEYADLKVALTQFTGTNRSLAASGYQKLPGGLILQWGAVTYSNIANINILFPITFPTQCFSVTSSIGDVDQENVEFITALSNSGFTARFKRISGTTPDAGTVYWFAIGY